MCRIEQLILDQELLLLNMYSTMAEDLPHKWILHTLPLCNERWTLSSCNNILYWTTLGMDGRFSPVGWTGWAADNPCMNPHIWSYTSFIKNVRAHSEASTFQLWLHVGKRSKHICNILEFWHVFKELHFPHRSTTNWAEGHCSLPSPLLCPQAWQQEQPARLQLLISLVTLDL